MQTSKALITAIKAVNNGKVQLELSENKQTNNVLGLLNASDDRFSNSSRKAWITGEPTDVKANFPALASAIDDVMAKGPGTSTKTKIAAILPNGIELRVEVRESFDPLDDYQKANITRSVKQNPSKGTVLLCDGKPIFSKTFVVGNEPNDARITHNGEMPIAEFNAQFAAATNTVAANTEQVS